MMGFLFFLFCQAEHGIRDLTVTGVQTCALPISLNVSNYKSTSSEITYGKEISKLLGGKHFVIDTSRNGNGPPKCDEGADDETCWCNPPGRALGSPPTASTADPLIDAYLWLKKPGESDGQCNGGPKAGVFWPDKAPELARNAKF